MKTQKNQQPNRGVKIGRSLAIFLCAAFLFSACSPQTTPAATVDTAAIQTQAAQTVIADLTKNAPPPSTQAPTPQAPATTEAPTAAPTQTEAPQGPVENSEVPAAMLPKPASGDPSATAALNTYIYSGPGEDYIIYGAFLGGMKALVTGKSEDGKWWAVSVPPAPGGNGWVDGAVVDVSNASAVPVLPTPPVPPTTDLVPPGPDDPQATSRANTYVRSGPGTNFPAYGVAPQGKTGRLIGVSQDDRWYAIRINPELVGAGYGWIEAAFVQAQNTEELQVIASPQVASAVPPSTPASGAPTAVTVEYVNVRTGPGTVYPTIGVAPPGATAEITGMSSDEDWWQIKIPAQYAENGFGWVSADYVYTVNTEDTPVAEAPAAPPVVDPEKPINTGNCTLLSQTPEDQTSFNADAYFTTTWVLQNNGESAWNTDDFDIRFLGAYNNVPMHQGPDVYDLPAQIGPSWSLPVTIPMVAPAEKGTYAEGWAIMNGNEVVCPFYVIITAK